MRSITFALIFGVHAALAASLPTTAISATTPPPVQTEHVQLDDRGLLSDITSLWGEATADVASIYSKGTSAAGSVLDEAHTIYSDVTASAKAAQTSTVSSSSGAPSHFLATGYGMAAAIGTIVSCYMITF
ncbi:hypothetical protein I316_01687 [Kwoniella heveanensis BCC8398]|uniref:Uncharacterized protein n=1 Tax=Kwoniella heveanensis BCC8398 TaxID=1296120 RepID=A0A1B9GZH9_9TREE|nr:hypothetical protein I316_01687 [Kwoniella heveanensis BCC8398]